MPIYFHVTGYGYSASVPRRLWLQHYRYAERHFDGRRESTGWFEFGFVPQRLGLDFDRVFSQQMVNASMGVVNATHVPMEMQTPLPAVPQAQPAMSNVTILGTQNGQAIVMLTAEQLQKVVLESIQICCCSKLLK